MDGADQMWNSRMSWKVQKRTHQTKEKEPASEEVITFQWKARIEATICTLCTWTLNCQDIEDHSFHKQTCFGKRCWPGWGWLKRLKDFTINPHPTAGDDWRWMPVLRRIQAQLVCIDLNSSAPLYTHLCLLSLWLSSANVHHVNWSSIACRVNANKLRIWLGDKMNKNPLW